MPVLNRPIRLGRVFGLEVSFNWSLLLIVLLIAWTMATDVLPLDVPGQATWAYWSCGVVGAFVFFGCLLAHEVSHALVARRKGVEGGRYHALAVRRSDPTERRARQRSRRGSDHRRRPSDQLRPGRDRLRTDSWVDRRHAPPLPTNLVAWLAILNLVLGVFNLVPAFPLDGGRLLSSLIWWRTGSRQRGTHRASQVGRVFAGLMIGAGLLEIFLGGSDAFVSGAWLAFIGWFLFSAAGVEDRQSRVLSSLSKVPVSAAMTAPVVTVPDWLTVEQLLGAGAGQRHFPICPLHDPAGEPSGFVCWQDLWGLNSAAQRQQRLRDFARPREAFPTAGPDEDLEAVLHRVGPALERGVLVMNGQELVGILSSVGIGQVAALQQAPRSQTPPGA